MNRETIVLSSRELFPFGGGGIGAYISEAARVLGAMADVTIVTASWHRDKYHELVALGDPRVDYGGAAVFFVEVPDRHEHGDFYSHMHLYSHRVLELLRDRFPHRGPDLIEFSDYLAEGFVAVQARLSGDPFLTNTLIALRLHTSAEMCHVLDGHLDQGAEPRVSRELERRTLQDADLLVQCGGDILGTYQRFYSELTLAPAVRIPYPLEPVEHTDLPAPPRDGPLRMLYVGRSERRKGVQDLIEALTSIPGEWCLTLLGLDTDTAPLGNSMRTTLEQQVGGDPRVRFIDGVPRAEVPLQMAAHDLLVLPSRWECWPYVALEGMLAGVPILATPVGGYREMIVPGLNGALTDAPTPDALRRSLAPLVEEPDALRAQRNPTAIRNQALALSDPDAIRASYRAILARPRGIRGRLGPTSAKARPLVSVVIPYYRLHRFVEEAIASVAAQTYPRIELLLINDGSFEPEDAILLDLAVRYRVRIIVRSNGGLGAARNFGIEQSRGRYVVPLDADNILEPTFIERGVELLESCDDLPFVTSWNRYIEEDGTPYPLPHLGYRPIGNWTYIVHERNVAGDATAVLRRSVFDRFKYSTDLTSFEDWALYRELHDAGLYGHVIPEMLWRYRVRPDSMLREVGIQREERLKGELDALMQERTVSWVPKSG